MKNSKTSILIFSLLIFIYCSSEEEQISIVELDTTTTSTTTSSTITETPESTTTTEIINDGCIPEDNKNINFDDLKNVQNFLNRYGFNAGIEDGLSGNQTREAIKKFQAYAGITIDGDLGPNTYDKMSTYTGCESAVNEYVSITTTTVVSSEEEVTETTSTATTTPTTTTTTVIPTSSGYGFQGMISPESGNFTSILTTKNENNSFCSSITPTYSEQNQKSDLGLPSIYNLYPSPPSLTAGVTTQIFNNNSSVFSVKVEGNGDKNFKFYFIEPFTSSYKALVPTSISTSPGLTEATFSKKDLTQGYWFYGYADNGSGGLIKSEGSREFLVGPALVQNDTDINSFHNVWLHSSQEIISNGEFVSNNSEMFITYIMDTGFNSFSDISNEVDLTTSTLTVDNASNYSPGDVVLVDNEFMLIQKISENTFTVERGYRNSIKQIHGIGTAVQKLIMDTDMKAVRGYALFKGEKGYSFSVSIGQEGMPAKFSISDSCPEDIYSLDYIRAYAWREKGDSLVKYVDSGSGNTTISNDKFYLHQGIKDYIFPEMFATDPSTGQFLNIGPKDENLSLGDSLSFDFAGIVSGSNEIKYIELEFDMFPTGTKLTSSRKIVFTPKDNEYRYTNTISAISETPVFTDSVWESGYRYVLSHVKIDDGVSELIFKNDSELENVPLSSKSTHSVYYLDQFAFTISGS